MLLSSLALSLFASMALAQTQNQIQRCANSVELISYEDIVTYGTRDDEHFFNATWTYNVTACTVPQQVPIVRISLRNEDAGTRTECDLVQFGTGQVLYSQCPTTLGEMARAARDAGNVNWAINLALGQRPTRYDVYNDFQVQFIDQPEPSGAPGRRKRRSGEQLFQCSPGYSYCPVGPKSFDCIETAHNLNSCGGCPRTEQGVDCTAINGVNAVSCQNSRCVVNSCERGFQVSTDRMGCIAHSRKRSTRR